jgi:hypothetical protein
MYTVTKGKRRQQLSCDTQLSAYKRAGWQIDGEQPSKPPVEPVKEVNTAEVTVPQVPVEEAKAKAKGEPKSACDDDACRDKLLPIARALGVKSAHFMGAETLRARIDEKTPGCDRETLRKIADELGLSVDKNAGADTLRRRIYEAMDAMAAE